MERAGGGGDFPKLLKTAHSKKKSQRARAVETVRNGARGGAWPMQRFATRGGRNGGGLGSFWGRFLVGFSTVEMIKCWPGRQLRILRCAILFSRVLALRPHDHRRAEQSDSEAKSRGSCGVRRARRAKVTSRRNEPNRSQTGSAFFARPPGNVQAVASDGASPLTKRTQFVGAGHFPFRRERMYSARAARRLSPSSFLPWSFWRCAG